MPPSTIEQLESELAEIFRNAPAGLTGNTELVTPKRHTAVTLRNGVSGQTITLVPEEVPRYAQMGIDYMRELRPVGELETGNAQLIFETRWRLHRILAAETELLRVSRARRTGTLRELDRIGHYENSLIRRVSRLTSELERLQAKRSETAPHLVFDENTSPAVRVFRAMLSGAN